MYSAHEDSFCEILARNYAPGSATHMLLEHELFGVISKSNMLLEHVLNATAPGAYLLYTHCEFKYVPPYSILDLEYYSRL